MKRISIIINRCTCAALLSGCFFSVTAMSDINEEECYSDLKTHYRKSAAAQDSDLIIALDAITPEFLDSFPEYVDTYMSIHDNKKYTMPKMIAVRTFLKSFEWLFPEHTRYNGYWTDASKYPLCAELFQKYRKGFTVKRVKEIIRLSDSIRFQFITITEDMDTILRDWDSIINDWDSIYDRNTHLLDSIGNIIKHECE